jgi:glutathione synthase/RimK-type ligase-like ATP-grasp enzyme
VYVAGVDAIGASVSRVSWLDARGDRAGDAVTPESQVLQAAVKAVQGLGLGFGAVDCAEAADGTAVLDVLPSPGLRGIHPEVRRRVIDALVAHAEARAVARIPV